jgi:hypothetical protein
MPYGMPNDMGGDNKKNDKWMESCVMKVMKTGKDKSSSIAICKSTYMKAHKDSTRASIDINLYLYNEFKKGIINV